MAWTGVFGGPVKDQIVYSTEEKKIFAATYKIAGTVTAFGVAGILVIALWAWGARGPALNFFSFVGVDLLVAGAAAAAGSLFGFVFGIPRSLDPASRAAAVAAAQAAQLNDQAASRAAMGVNTNLERISDWLTTLLIGATLVQIKDIAAWIGKLGKGLMADGAAANDAVVPIIVIYYFALSFLGVYLITRLYLTSALGWPGLSAAPSPEPATRHGLSELKQTLKAAAASGNADDMKGATDRFVGWNFKPGEDGDPALNADLARILARQMQAGGAGDRAKLLKSAVARAAADTTIKKQLKGEFDAGTLKTSNAGLDTEILALLT